MKRWIIVSWVLQVVVAGLLFQTLFFKFTAAPESVYIFQTLGMEPHGRILIGIFELGAAVLILLPFGIAIGALLSSGLMIGAILAHLTKLGISVQGDGGLLFFLALAILGSSVVILCLRKEQIPFFGKTL